MDKHIQLSITSPTTEVTVNSVDAEEVARLVRLAGIQKPESSLATPVSMPAVSQPMGMPADMPIDEPISMPATEPEFGDIHADDMDSSLEVDHIDDEFSTDVDNDIHDLETHDHVQEIDSAEPMSGFHIGEQQAPFDHGNNPVEADGEEISVNDYLYKSERLPQRIKGTQGDSGLLEQIHHKLIQKYHAYLSEEVDRENDDGVLSPLSDPTKPKFDKDPLSDETPVDDGSHSPMSTIVRQSFYK